MLDFMRIAFAGVVAGLVLLVATDSSRAAEPSGCDIAQATTFRATGSSYRARRQYAQAARQFLAAQRSTQACRTSSGSMLNAQSLVEAGTLLAGDGDYAGALAILHLAQGRLTAIGGEDRQGASAVRPYLETVETITSAINTIAKGSM